MICQACLSALLVRGLSSAGHVDEAAFRAILDQIHVPHFTPRKGVKIQTKEDATSKVEESVSALTDPPLILAIH